MQQAATLSTRQARSHYRHQLPTLTYVTIDDGNGGIIRNLNHEGVAVQAVGALRVEQRVRLRFELRLPRLRVDAYGHVSWANASGQCGVRFDDLSPRTRDQINQWIFSDLLDAAARDSGPQSMFGASVLPIDGRELKAEPDDGLTVSPTPRPAIRLESGFDWVMQERVVPQHGEKVSFDSDYEPYTESNWLSRPISAGTLAWLVDSLVVIAALLLFAVTFLSIAHEVPEWPITLSAALAAAAFIAGSYWGLFALFGGSSVGARLAHSSSVLEEKEECLSADRFR
jgi:hypothetical protein